MHEDETTIADCGRCVVRGVGCADCAVSVLLNAPPTVEWDAEELHAMELLADEGLIPPLRLTPLTERERYPRAA